MDLASVIITAIALAMDAFSVSVSAGMIIKKPDFRQYFRLSFHFGLFQFMMPVIGYFAGSYIENYIKDYDHWIAFSLLLFIGSKMIAETFSEKNKDVSQKKDPSKGVTLVILALATSIDAFAVGITLGVINREILLPSIIIGIVCLSFSILGITIGKRLSHANIRAEIIGGILLIIIGIKILFEHIF